MKGITSFENELIAWLVYLLTIAIIWLYMAFSSLSDRTVQSNVAEVVPDNIKTAIMNMGSRYHYRLLPDGTLQVDKGDGRWLKLNYERR